MEISFSHIERWEVAFLGGGKISSNVLMFNFSINYRILQRLDTAFCEILFANDDGIPFQKAIIKIMHNRKIIE
jgi:hypothetical protein